MSAANNNHYAVRLQNRDGTYFPDAEVEKLDWFTRATAEHIAGTAYNAAAQKPEKIMAVEIIDIDLNIVQREEIEYDE